MNLLVRTIRGATLGLCSPAEKPWIEAMFAEISVIEGTTPRLIWTLGFASLIAVSIKKRGAIMLANRLNLATVVAFLSMLLTGGVSQVGYEGTETLDDVFLALAFVFGAIFATLVAVALGRFTVRAWSGMDLDSDSR